MTYSSCRICSHVLRRYLSLKVGVCLCEWGLGLWSEGLMCECLVWWQSFLELMSLGGFLWWLLGPLGHTRPVLMILGKNHIQPKKAKLARSSPQATLFSFLPGCKQPIDASGVIQITTQQFHRLGRRNQIHRNSWLQSAKCWWYGFTITDVTWRFLLLWQTHCLASFQWPSI